MISEEILQTPGDIRIKRLKLISASGNQIDILDYLVELNIYESIFAPTLTGSLTLGDSRNLIKNFPIIGEEIILVEVSTPGTQILLEKIFRVNSIVDKNYVSDGSSQIYTLQISSIELFRNISNPIYKSFQGTPSDIIRNIYDDYLKVTRNVTEQNTGLDNFTPLTVFSSTKNIVKFVSPGWTPIQCINWLCAHSEASNNRACNFLFWETNKGFYFGSIEDIALLKDNISAGNYYYSASMINSKDSVGTKMLGIRDISFDRVFDQFENKRTGFLSSRTINVDLMNKTYENYDYDYTSQFNSYKNLTGDNAYPLHSINTSRNPLVHKVVNYSLPGLYSNAPGNFSERFKFVYGNRRSNILKLYNMSLTMVVPGRTDLEAGSIIDVSLPRGFPNSPEDSSSDSIDTMYSGKYLITSLNHKINPITHFITLDATKDSISMDDTYAK